MKKKQLRTKNKNKITRKLETYTAKNVYLWMLNYVTLCNCSTVVKPDLYDLVTLLLSGCNGALKHLERKERSLVMF